MFPNLRERRRPRRARSFGGEQQMLAMARSFARANRRVDESPRPSPGSYRR